MTNQPSGMDTQSIFLLLNQLKKEKVILDYVIVGGVAALRYIEPRQTKDIDILVPVDDLLREYPAVWSAIKERSGGGVQGQMIDIGGTWLDVMATGGDQFHEEVLENASVVKLYGVRVKVARPEHLIMMSLIAWRPNPDYSRITALMESRMLDSNSLNALLDKHDKDGRLRQRLAWLTGAHP